MIGFSLEEEMIRLTAQERGVFERFQAPKQLIAGLSVVFGKVRETKRWEVYAFLFEKSKFNTTAEAQAFADKFLKMEIRAVLNYNTFSESRRRWLNAYLQVSSVQK